LKHLFKIGKPCASPCEVTKAEPKAKKTRTKGDKDGKRRFKKQLVPLPQLPDDVLCVIFSFCNLQELLLSASLICKRWNSIIASGRVYIMDQWIQRKCPFSNVKFRLQGREFFDKKLWDQAIKCFTKAILLNPRDHLSYFWRAYAFDESGQFDLAVKDFTNSLLYEPHDATAYSNRGATYRDMGEPEKALRDLTKAAEMDPNSAPVYNNVGVVLGDMGRFEEALAAYSKALEIDPRHTVAIRNRGRRLEKMGRVSEASKDFEKVLQLDSTDVVALRFFQNQKIPAPISCV